MPERKQIYQMTHAVPDISKHTDKLVPTSTSEYISLSEI